MKAQIHVSQRLKKNTSQLQPSSSEPRPAATLFKSVRLSRKIKHRYLSVIPYLLPFPSGNENFYCEMSERKTAWTYILLRFSDLSERNASRNTVSLI